MYLFFFVMTHADKNETVNVIVNFVTEISTTILKILIKTSLELDFHRDINTKT